MSGFGLNFEPKLKESGLIHVLEEFNVRIFKSYIDTHGMFDQKEDNFISFEIY